MTFGTQLKGHLKAKKGLKWIVSTSHNEKLYTWIGKEQMVKPKQAKPAPDKIMVHEAMKKKPKIKESFKPVNQTFVFQVADLNDTHSLQWVPKAYLSTGQIVPSHLWGKEKKKHSKNK